MGDGLEGRCLTGLLTVKRENFPGMRELGAEGGRGGRCWSGVQGRKSAWGAGCSWEGCLWSSMARRANSGGGHLSPGPTSAPHPPPFLSLSLRKGGNP